MNLSVYSASLMMYAEGRDLSAFVSFNHEDLDQSLERYIQSNGEGRIF